MIEVAVLMIFLVFLMLFAILAYLIIFIWAILDVILSKMDVAKKLFWILIILIFQILGIILYIIFRLVGGTMAKAKLKRSKDKMIAGVCAGIAEYLKVDTTVVRLIWALGTLFTGIFPGVVAYIIAWIIMPE